MDVGVKLEKADRDLIEQHIMLAKTEYPDQEVTSAKHLSWKYLDNPQGTAVSRSMYEAGELIGKILYQPRRFRTLDKTFHAAYLVDLLILASKRGITKFLRLMGEVRETEEFDFILVTPNSNSAPLYRALLGFDEVFQMDAVACPLQFEALLSRVLSIDLPFLPNMLSTCWKAALKLMHMVCVKSCNIDIRETCPPESVFDETVRRITASGTAVGERSYTFHQWRFHQSSLRKYEPFYVFDEKSNFVGYFVLREMWYEGLECLFLIDIFIDPSLSFLSRLLILLKAVNVGCEKRCDLIFSLLSLSSPLLSRFCLLPFVKIPKKLLPQQVPVFFAQGAKEQNEKPQRDGLFLTMADMDVF
jgi:hypothetical protein